MRLSVRGGVLAFGLVLLAQPAQAATVCVCGAGGDDTRSKAAVTASASGRSCSAPWATIGRAAWGSENRNAPDRSEAAAPGDTVHVCAGTYASALNTGTGRYDVLYNPVNSGSSASPIVFVADGAVAVRAPSWGGPVIGASGRNHVRWTGPFLIDETAILTAPDTGPVVFVNATGSGVDGATIHGSGAPWADNHVGARIDSCDQCFVRNTRIDNFKSLQGGTSRNGAGVMLYDSDDTLIEHNEIFDCGSGIYIKGVQQATQLRTIVRFNLIRDTLAFGVIVQHTTDGRVYQNVIRDNPVGILFSGTSEPGQHPRNDIVANNTLDGNGTAVTYNGVSESVRFWNNIISNSATAHYSDDAGPGDVTIEHNNYFDVTGHFARFRGVRHTFSNWKRAFSQDGAEPDSSARDPLYANGTGKDFRLCAGPRMPASSCSRASPARTLGVDLLDLDGDTSTSDTVPVGAYVTGEETIGPAGETDVDARRVAQPRATAPIGDTR